MGAKTWMLVYASGIPKDQLIAKPALDRQATQAWVESLFPGEALEVGSDGDLSYTNPPEDEVFAGCFGDLAIVATHEVAVDNPTKIPQRFLEAANGRDIYLHAMHSVVDWLAFAVWRNGTLRRSLSLAPDSGVVENIGEPLMFEQAYWSGDHPADDPEEIEAGEDPYPLPFHPLELGEAALREFFGYQLEGYVDPSLLEPDTVPLMRFKRKKKPRFKFW